MKPRAPTFWDEVWRALVDDFRTFPIMGLHPHDLVCVDS